MGKKSSQPSQSDPLPHMDPPPPYDTVTRSSTSSSVRSVDRLDPDGTGIDGQPQQAQNTDTTRGDPATARRNGANSGRREMRCDKRHRDGGYIIYGENTNVCTNLQPLVEAVKQVILIAFKAVKQVILIAFEAVKQVILIAF